MLPQRSANGVLILVLGILSVTGFGILTGLPAWIMGNTALDQIDRGEADSGERQMVVIGRFLGMLMSGILIGAIVICVLAFGAMAVYGSRQFR